MTLVKGGAIEADHKRQPRDLIEFSILACLSDLWDCELPRYFRQKTTIGILLRLLFFVASDFNIRESTFFPKFEWSRISSRVQFGELGRPQEAETRDRRAFPFWSAKFSLFAQLWSVYWCQFHSSARGVVPNPRDRPFRSGLDISLLRLQRRRKSASDPSQLPEPPFLASHKQGRKGAPLEGSLLSAQQTKRPSQHIFQSADTSVLTPNTNTRLLSPFVTRADNRQAKIESSKQQDFLN